MVQFFKFCCVGLSSTIIDKGIFTLLVHFFGAGLWAIFSCISFCFGVTNGYYWNRRWTFSAASVANSRAQYVKFVVTNIIGLALNLLITKGILIMMLGHIQKPDEGDKGKVILASLCAVPIVVIWNFSAARFWTFKPAKPANNSEGTSTVPPITSR